jgi:hypothetical protein
VVGQRERQVAERRRRKEWDERCGFGILLHARDEIRKSGTRALRIADRWRLGDPLG